MWRVYIVAFEGERIEIRVIRGPVHNYAFRAGSPKLSRGHLPVSRAERPAVSGISSNVTARCNCRAGLADVLVEANERESI